MPSRGCGGGVFRPRPIFIWRARKSSRARLGQRQRMHAKRRKLGGVPRGGTGNAGRCGHTRWAHMYIICAAWQKRRASIASENASATRPWRYHRKGSARRGRDLVKKRGRHLKRSRRLAHTWMEATRGGFRHCRGQEGKSIYGRHANRSRPLTAVRGLFKASPLPEAAEASEPRLALTGAPPGSSEKA